MTLEDAIAENARLLAEVTRLRALRDALYARRAALDALVTLAERRHADGFLAGGGLAAFNELDRLIREAEANESTPTR